MSSITLRAWQDDDSKDIAALLSRTAETGVLQSIPVFTVDYKEVQKVVAPSRVIVVAEAPDGGIVGMAAVDFGNCQYEGDVVPFAYLNTLAVHPDFRKQGIAAQLAAWRVAKANERVGAHGVIYTTIQSGNEGSFRTAQKWATQRLDRMGVAIAPLRRRPPSPEAGITVREAAEADYEQIAAHQNRFYSDFNFYKPSTGIVVANRLRRTIAGKPMSAYFVAVNARGTLVGGMEVEAQGQYVYTQVKKMPLMNRLVARVLGMVSSDGIARQVLVKRWWFESDVVGRYVWDMVRWLWRERGNTINYSYDRHSLYPSVLRFPFYMPPLNASVLLRATTPMSETHPFTL